MTKVAIRETVTTIARPQLSFLRSLLLLAPFLYGLVYVSVRLHYTLPAPQQDLFDATGAAQFSEKQAMKYIWDLAVHPDNSPRYRILGTEEMVETEEYLIKAVEKIRDEVVAKMGGLHQIEIWHQTGSGAHLFEFMEKQVWKKYYEVGNVVVRLSDGTDASKANAVLVNAHADSTLPSPGAADDLVGCATMLEALRVMALTPRKLTNSVVFLFNGAEESLQDASHLFITQHPLKSSIRAVINLEACGVGGPEIVFQATSEEMIRALAHTPRPYATVVATEIFSSGLILSDTDFRQFAQYGNLTGLDMAIVQGSYLYHTRLDMPEQIEAGALQHMGENTLALLNYLTSAETLMGNSPSAVPLPLAHPSDTIFFSALGGKLFFIYSRAQATLLYGGMAAITAIVVSDRVDWSRKGVYIAGAVGVFGSFVGALVGANLAAFVTGVVMNKSLAWFRHEAFPVVLYAPPAFIGATLFQRTLSNFIRTPFASDIIDLQENSLLEHAAMVGQVVYYTLATVVGHAFGLGSTYLSALTGTSVLVALLVNDYVIKRGSRSMSPLLLGGEGLVGILDMFVPLTGRMDFIVASLTAGIGYLAVPMFLPFVHRYGAMTTSRIALGLTFFSAATIGWFTRPSWNSFDRMHPKRLLILHMENTTTSPPGFELHVAAVDGAPFFDLVAEATQPLSEGNALPIPHLVNDHSSDWDIIFPVSQFLTSYRVPLPPTPSSYASPWSSFTVTAQKNVLNSIKQTRSLEIVMDHPGLMWPVIAFDADVLSWDLSEAPERGNIRHHVKSAASYGVSRFTLSLTIQLTKEQFEAAVRQNQRSKGQRAGDSEEDRALGSLRIDYSGLDSKGMYPASSRHETPEVFKPGMTFFSILEKRLPPEVDAMLLSAVGIT
ncbi:endoplasmic reticulum metallopeptidase [Pseudohyphozyma bogoriensis]|nr:endoplasmic reticulum metallopeptidase [Pseudohyphozyma bogoriensis]